MVKSMEALEEDFRAKTPKSIQQWQAGRPIMPAGVMKGAHFMAPHPVYVDHAEDCYLFDIDGNRYVDFANHHTAAILGHSPPQVVEALHTQVDRGIAFGTPTTLEREVAEELVNRIPSVEMVRYTNSGTEASLNAARVVRAVTGRPLIAKFEGAYHGSNDAVEFNTKGEAGPREAPETIATWRGMPEGGEANVVVLTYNDIKSVELTLREHKDRLAAVFFDGRAGWYDMPLDFARFLRKITEELGILLVFDEVISFRSSYSGYQGLAGVEPDLTIFGKIVGGGMPVGALGGKAAVMDILDNSGEPTGLYHSGTFAGNHFTLAAGLATLRALTPEVYEHLNALRARLEANLQDVLARSGHPYHLFSQGSTVRVYFSEVPVRSHRDNSEVDGELFSRLVIGLLVKGYYARDGMGFILSNPMTEEHVDGLAQAVDEVLKEG